MHVSKVRKKLGDTITTSTSKTMSGVGYIFARPGERREKAKVKTSHEDALPEDFFSFWAALACSGACNPGDAGLVVPSVIQPGRAAHHSLPTIVLTSMGDQQAHDYLETCSAPITCGLTSS